MSTIPDSLPLSRAWFDGEETDRSRSDPRVAALVERARSGCHEAYRQLVELHRHRVFRFCLGWTGNPEDAEELCQDTFIRAYSALPRYRDEDHFGSWLFRIARNRCHDHHRSRSRRQSERNHFLDAEKREALVCSAPRPDEKVSGTEELAVLWRAIASLPERLREVLVLCGLEGMSHEDCAALLGCSRRAVEGRLYRARLDLAAKLKD